MTRIATYAFYRCPSLTTITLPSGLNSIGDYAFQECANLTSITIGTGVTTIGDFAFENCRSLNSITFKDDAPSVGYRWLDQVSDDLTIYCYEGSIGFDGPDWEGLKLKVISASERSSGDTLIAMGIVIIVFVAIVASMQYIRKR